MNDVFISYSSADEERVARSIVDPLQEMGVNIFFSERTIKAAEKFADVIGDAIRECDWFIVVATSNSVDSRWVREEVNFALSHSRLDERILPVLMDSVELTHLSWRLGERHHVDLTTKGGDEKLQQAFTRIAESGASST